MFSGAYEGSIKTRHRYKEAEERFTESLASKFRLQKISNVKEKHLAAYVQHIKTKVKHNQQSRRILRV